MAEKKKTQKRIMNGKGKYARIRSNQERDKSNLKRVLKSSGIEAGKAYATLKNLGSYLAKVLKGRQSQPQSRK